VSASLIVELLASDWLMADLNATLQSIEEKEEAAVTPLLATSHAQRHERQESPNTASGSQSASDDSRPTRAPRAHPHRAAPVRVWEDVYTGYILSRLVGADDGPRLTTRERSASGTSKGLAVVEYGFGNGRAHPHYSDGYGQQLAPSTLVWHMRTKKRTAYRVAFAHHWLVEEGRHCTPPPAHRWVRCGRNTQRASTTSCAGARWLRCTSMVSAWSRPLVSSNNVLSWAEARRHSTTNNCSSELVELKHASRKWLQGVMSQPFKA
jgi:hypothetical protein